MLVIEYVFGELSFPKVCSFSKRVMLSVRGFIRVDEDRKAAVKEIFNGKIDTLE